MFNIIFFTINFFQSFVLNLLNNWTLKRKRKINNIKCIVSPSYWLKSIVLNDPHFSKFRIEVIPNSLDTNLFKPKKNKNLIINILIHFESKSNLLKGGDLVLEFINSLNSDSNFDNNINFKIVGNSSSNAIDLPNVINYGFVNTESELAKIYQSSNICISFSSLIVKYWIVI